MKASRSPAPKSEREVTLERKSIRVRLEPNTGQREKLAQAAGP